MHTVSLFGHFETWDKVAFKRKAVQNIFKMIQIRFKLGCKHCLPLALLLPWIPFPFLLHLEFEDIMKSHFT